MSKKKAMPVQPPFVTKTVEEWRRAKAEADHGVQLGILQALLRMSIDSKPASRETRKLARATAQIILSIKEGSP